VRKNLVAIAVLVVMVCGSTRSTAVAQEAPPSQPPSPTSPKKVQNIPLELQVIISRFQGEKRISSLPYVLSLKSFTNSNRAGFAGASLRLGSRVPIRSQVFAPPSDGKPVPTTSVNYENIGTNIDAGASALEDGRFEVTISINESSVVTDPQDLRATPGSDSYPVFRSYQSTNTLFVKDGQPMQFTAASDRVSGEVVRVEVKLTVVK
jgi:hypothetical protein